MTHDEICKCFGEDTLFAMQAPTGTKLSSKKLDTGKCRLHIKSTEGQVYVSLVNKDSESDEPEAVRVSPTKDPKSADSEVESLFPDNPESLLAPECKQTV